MLKKIHQRCVSNNLAKRLRNAMLTLFLIGLFTAGCSQSNASLPTPEVMEIMIENVTKESQELITATSAIETATSTAAPTATPLTNLPDLAVEDTPLILLNSDGRFVRSSIDGRQQRELVGVSNVPSTSLEDGSAVAHRGRLNLSPDGNWYAGVDGSTLHIVSLTSLQENVSEQGVKNFGVFLAWSQDSKFFAFRAGNNNQKICVGSVETIEINCPAPFEGKVLAAAFSPLNSTVLAVSAGTDLANPESQPIAAVYHLNSESRSQIGLHLVPFETSSSADLFEWTTAGLIVHGTEESLDVDLLYDPNAQTTTILDQPVIAVSPAGTYFVDDERALYAADGAFVSQLTVCPSAMLSELLAWRENMLAHYVKCDGDEHEKLSVTNLLDGKSIAYAAISSDYISSVSQIESLRWYHSELIASFANGPSFQELNLFFINANGKITPIACGSLLIGTLGSDWAADVETELPQTKGTPPETMSAKIADGTLIYINKELGIKIEASPHLEVPINSETQFVITKPLDGPHAAGVLTGRWRDDASSADFLAMAQAEIDESPTLEISSYPIQVAGYEGLAVGLLPGTES